MANGYYFGMGSQGDVSKALGFNQQGFQNTATSQTSPVNDEKASLQTAGGVTPCYGGYEVDQSATTCPDGYYIVEKGSLFQKKKYCCPGTGEFSCQGGYKPPMAGGKQLVACKTGYTPKTNPKTGEKWCCKKSGEEVKSCTSDAECVAKYGADYKCLNGECKKVVNPGDECVSDADCAAKGANFKCQNGKCVDTGGGGGTTECEGTGEAYTGCNCGKYFATTTGNCPTGYVFISRTGTGWEGYKPGAIGRCECQKWCQDIGAGSNCTGSDSGTGLGEFKWPDELQALWKLLVGRGTDLLNKDLGYSDEAMADMFGLNFEKLRDKEYGTRQQQLSDLSRQGMLGTGAANEQLAQTAWNTESGISDVMRELFVGNEEKKKQDLLDYTNLAQSLFGTGMSYSQILEAINSARRGEASASYQTLISLILSMMGLS